MLLMILVLLWLWVNWLWFQTIEYGTMGNLDGKTNGNLKKELLVQQR